MLAVHLGLNFNDTNNLNRNKFVQLQQTEYFSSNKWKISYVASTGWIGMEPTIVSGKNGMSEPCFLKSNRYNQREN